MGRAFRIPASAAMIAGLLFLAGGAIAAEAGQTTTDKVTVATWAFNVNMRLPKATIGANDFDIDGVKLYPGSAVGPVRVDSTDKNKVIVDLDFTSPADAKTVTAWFARGLAEKHIDFERDGATLKGNIDDKGEAFFVITVVDAASKGAPATKGTIHLVAG